jgi:hypothetical protein
MILQLRRSQVGTLAHPAERPGRFSPTPGHLWPFRRAPPGPLHELGIVPRRSRLLPGATRGFAAKALDESGRALASGVEYTWRLISGEGVLEARGQRASFTAGGAPGSVRLGASAREGERLAEAEAEVEVVAKLEGEGPDGGIPEPRRVFDPAGDRRSRIAGRRWEYNAAHLDYQAVVYDPRRRLRYLVHLLAKEIAAYKTSTREPRRCPPTATSVALISVCFRSVTCPCRTPSSRLPERLSSASRTVRSMQLRSRMVSLVSS